MTAHEPGGQPLENPYQPPDSVITAPTSRPEPLLPSRWRRLGAAAIDMAIGLVCSIPVFVYQIQVLGIEWGEPLSIEHEAGVFVYSALMFFMVNGYLLIKRGQTVGKFALGIKIATAYYAKPSLFSLTVIRTYAFWLLSYHQWLAIVGLIDVLFIFRKDKRCLHDHVASTTVVDASVTYNPG